MGLMNSLAVHRADDDFHLLWHDLKVIRQALHFTTTVLNKRHEIYIIGLRSDAEFLVLGCTSSATSYIESRVVVLSFHMFTFTHACLLYTQVLIWAHLDCSCIRSVPPEADLAAMSRTCKFAWHTRPRKDCQLTIHAFDSELHVMQKV